MRALVVAGCRGLWHRSHPFTEAKYVLIRRIEFRYRYLSLSGVLVPARACLYAISCGVHQTSVLGSVRMLTFLGAISFLPDHSKRQSSVTEQCPQTRALSIPIASPPVSTLQQPAQSSPQRIGWTSRCSGLPSM